jgi:hypothetical protein
MFAFMVGRDVVVRMVAICKPADVVESLDRASAGTKSNIIKERGHTVYKRSSLRCEREFTRRWR